MSSLKVTVIPVDMKAILLAYLVEINSNDDCIYCFNNFNNRVNEAIMTLMNIESPESEPSDDFEETLVNQIKVNAVSPSNVLEITTTTGPGNVVEIDGECYKVPLILQIEPYKPREDNVC